MKALETQELTKVYTTGWIKRKQLLALDRLTFEVESGEIFGFLGPNGAGKSTTIKLLLGLVIPTSGSGSIFGCPIHNKKARERVGFLPEDPSFCPYMCAEEFLDLCGKVLHMERAERKKRITEVLELVGLSSKARDRISEFSRGMVQRIGLAQALLNMPDLVVLDEPLNGLDPYGRKELKAILFDQKAKGKAVFFSSHILSDVQEICDRIAILNQGSLIACGSLKDLLPVKTIKFCVPVLNMTTMPLLEKIMCSILHEHEHWVIELPDPSKKDEVYAILEKDGIQSIEMTETPVSLENYFFEKIAQNNAERGLTNSLESTHLLV